MAYREEYKKEILEQMKIKTVTQIAKETGISKATLYNWKREKNRGEISNKEFGKEIAKPIKANMEIKQEDEIEELEILAKANPLNKSMQTRLMKMYVKGGKEEEAIKFAKAEANLQNQDIQTQLMEMYVEKGKEEEAIELAKANKQNAQIQKQLIALYRRRKGQTIQLAEPNAEKEEAQQEINEEQEEIENNDNQDNIASVVVEELSNEEKKEEIVVEEHIANEDIVDNSTHTSKKKTNNNAKKAKSIKVSRKYTIENSLSKTLKETISKINCYYYVHMQPSIQGSYEESKRQEKYIKKYDKLQSILGCDTNNKRAQMELMLVLINEGYREVVKREFPEKDYEFVDEIIKGYYAKTIKPQDAKREIDEYCM